jgi:hypothetical protein
MIVFTTSLLHHKKNKILPGSALNVVFLKKMVSHVVFFALNERLVFSAQMHPVEKTGIGRFN